MLKLCSKQPLDFTLTTGPSRFILADFSFTRNNYALIEGFQVSISEGLGYSKNTGLGRLMKGEYELSAEYCSRLPNGVKIRGLHDYLVVERVLKNMRPIYRKTAMVEFVAPTPIVGRTLTERAQYMGTTKNTHNGRL